MVALAIKLEDFDLTSQKQAQAMCYIPCIEGFEDAKRKSIEEYRLQLVAGLAKAADVSPESVSKNIAENTIVSSKESGQANIIENAQVFK